MRLSSLEAVATEWVGGDGAARSWKRACEKVRSGEMNGAAIRE